MLKLLKSQTVISALVLSLIAGNASAMTLNRLTDVTPHAQSPVVKVHSLHMSCMRGSVTPSGTGQPVLWHKTKEAGVHTSCTPPRATGGKLKIAPSGGSRNTNSLKLNKS